MGAEIDGAEKERKTSQRQTQKVRDTNFIPASSGGGLPSPGKFASVWNSSAWVVVGGGWSPSM